MLWRFTTYVTSHGRNEVQDTINRYNDDDQAAFSRQIAHLAQCTKDKWDEPHAKKIRGKDGLFEIRYRANRCATRALGFFHPDGKTFVIVLICTHKQDVYNPPEAFKSAENRMALVQAGTSSTVPLQINGEDFPSDED